MCLFNFEEPIYYEQVNGELKMEQKKITIDLIRQMIMDAMEDMELIQPYPLMAEPKVGLDRSEDVMEGSVKSYKGNRETVDHAVEALKHLRQLTPQQRAPIFRQFGVQTYNAFIQAISKYAKASKGKD
tara:strand:- start:307 stop:690 length:384 start_codon:yes stop_codon:yes gene_type:complete